MNSANIAYNLAAFQSAFYDNYLKGSEKYTQPRNVTKKSFTIDAILGNEEVEREETKPKDLHLSFYERNRYKYEGVQQQRKEWKIGKNKRIRTIFTPEQLERLEAEFERQQYMVGTERFYLASSLNLTEAQVKVWFQNRRIKWRKQNLEKQHAKLERFYTDYNQNPEETPNN